MQADTTLAPTEREQFEAWVRSEFPGVKLRRKGKFYSHPPTSEWWLIWQAARRAQAAPQGPALQYRLLRADIDRIEPTDEFLSDDTLTWAIDPGGVFVGMPYAARVLRPARRAVTGGS